MKDLIMLDLLETLEYQILADVEGCNISESCAEDYLATIEKMKKFLQEN